MVRMIGAPRRSTSRGSRRLIRDIEPAVQATPRLIFKPLKGRERGAFKQIQMLKHLVHLNNAHSHAPWRPKR